MADIDAVARQPLRRATGRVVGGRCPPTLADHWRRPDRLARGVPEHGWILPALETYAWRLWDYWERHLDPDLRLSVLVRAVSLLEVDDIGRGTRFGEILAGRNRPAPNLRTLLRVQRCGRAAGLGILELSFFQTLDFNIKLYLTAQADFHEVAPKSARHGGLNGSQDVLGRRRLRRCWSGGRTGLSSVCRQRLAEGTRQAATRAG